MIIPQIPDKPFANYAEQIANLKKHNISISNERFAEQVLHSISYYTLANGYKDVFSDNGSYPSQIEFEELYTLHSIAIDLSNLLLKYVLIEEKSFKTKLSYLISKNYGVCTDLDDLSCINQNDYLYQGYYSNALHQRRPILKLIKKEAPSHPNRSFEHYKSNKNHIPPWILIDNIPFGLSIKWFSILKSDAKKEFCDEYFSHLSFQTDADKKELCRKCLDILKDYRNIFAHGGRIIGAKSSAKLIRPHIVLLSCGCISKKQIRNGIGENDITSLILILANMANNKYICNNLQIELHGIFDKYLNSNTKIASKNILELFNIPNSIFEILTQISNNRFIH